MWWASLRRAVPVLALGLLRLWSVSGTNYQSHVSEYGVHWNFFFTLAAVQLLATALVRGGAGRGAVPVRHCGLLAAALLVLHQTALSVLGLTSFILHAPRRSWVEQNREGIVSVVGYLALHLLGLRIGAHIHRSQRRPTVHQHAHCSGSLRSLSVCSHLTPARLLLLLCVLVALLSTAPAAVAGMVVEHGRPLQLASQLPMALLVC